MINISLQTVEFVSIVLSITEWNTFYALVYRYNWMYVLIITTCCYVLVINLFFRMMTSIVEKHTSWFERGKETESERYRKR